MTSTQKTITNALWQARQAGHEARSQGAMPDAIDGLWAMEMDARHSSDTWDEILAHVSQDEARAEYLKGLRGDDC